MSLLRTSPCRTCRTLSRHLRGLATAVDSVNAGASSHKNAGNRVRIVEVGPRDGLQNEKQQMIPLKTKIELIERLAKTGLKDIEAGAFVVPKRVPQMANSDEILDRIITQTPPSPHRICYSFLIPNTKGLDNAMAVLNRSPGLNNGVPNPPPSLADGQQGVWENASRPQIEFSVFAAATESFARANLNCDIATSLERFKPVIQGAKAAGYRVRAYISVVLGCPFEGIDVDPQKVAEIATDLLEMGADEISLGDTTGRGTAPRTRALLRAMTAAGVRNEDIAMHFHDTCNHAVLNTAVSLEHGIRTFDSSVGGLGGCPYSPGATGNVATEDMVYLMESLGMETGVDLDAVVNIGSWITTELGKTGNPYASGVGKYVLGQRSRT